MSYDGTVKIATELDSAKAVSEMRKFSTVAKSGLKIIGKMGTTAISTIAGVGAGLTAAGAIGVRYNAQMEQYMASFETLLGNTENAYNHLEALKAYASKTPFEMPEIADASRTLLSFGVDSENVMSILNRLGDVSLGNSEKFSSLALVYGQVASQGKLMGQDLLQCINAGFNPLQVISERTGQSMAELKKQMSEGAISAEMVAQAFQWATEEGGMFHDGILKQSETFDGLISTLEDNAKALAGEVVQPISEAMTKQLLPAAIEAIEAMTEAYEKEGLEGLADATGKAFGEAVSMAASSAPKMVKVSVTFVKSFAKGIKNNKSQIKTAALDLAKTLTNELLNALPKSVRQPVKETIKEITDSLKKGGLHEAGEYVIEIFEKIGNGALKLGKSALPILTKSLDFCADNLEIIIPLATAYFAAMKGYAVVDKTTKVINGVSAAWKAATAVIEIHTAANRLNLVAMAGGTTLAETAIALLTGKITIATAAQWAWNTALSANPIALVAAGIAALIGGVALLSKTTKEAADSSDLLKESNEKLAESYSGIGEAAKSFEEGIKEAGSIFDNFNDSIIISAEKQQELADSMDSVQKEITEITGTYVETRKNLTDAEIQELDRLFERLHEQAAAELEAQQAYQVATEERARLLAETHQGTAEEYALASQTIINTAEQTKAQVIEKANEQFNEELALLQLRLQNDQNYTQAMYDTEARAAQATYDAVVASANRQCGDTLSVLTEGYAKHATALSESNATMAALREEELLENENYNIRKAELDKQLENSVYLQGETAYSRQVQLTTALQTLQEEHQNKIADIHKRMSENMDTEAQNQAGTLMDMAANVTLYGGKIKNNTEQLVDGVLTTLETMPGPAKETAIETMNGMIEGLESKEAELYAKAETIANGVIARLKKALDVHSPSRKTRKIFNYVMKGNILGLDDEKEKFYSKADEIVSGMIKRFSGAEIDTSFITEKMNHAIAMKRAQMQIDMAGKDVENSTVSGEDKDPINYRKFADVLKETLDGMGITMDDREFARLVWEVS